MSKRLKSYFSQITSILRSDGTIGGTRFLKKDQPTQATFTDLVDSTVFSAESGDRAKPYIGGAIQNEQGLAVLATDSQAKAGATQLSDRSLVVQPSQLPSVQDSKISGGSDISGSDVSLNAPNLVSTGFDITTNSTLKVTIDPSISTKNNYLIRFSNYYLNWLSSIVLRLLPSGGNTGQALKKTSGTDYATSWQNAGYNTASSTSNSISTGSKTFIVSNSSLEYQFGNRVRVFNDNSHYMEGVVQSYSSSSINILIDNIVGTGTFSNWTIGLGGTPATQTFTDTGETYNNSATSSSISVSTNYQSVVFTVNPVPTLGIPYQLGQRIRATGSAGNYISGIITAVSSPTITVFIDQILGTGSFTSWSITLDSGIPSVGWTAITTFGSSNISSGYILYRKNSNGMVELRGGLNMAATLGVANALYQIASIPGITLATSGNFPITYIPISVSTNPFFTLLVNATGGINIAHSDATRCASNGFQFSLVFNTF